MTWVYDLMLEWVYPLFFLGLVAVGAFYVLGWVVYGIVVGSINLLEWVQSK